MHDAWLLKFASDEDDAAVVAIANAASRRQARDLARIGVHRAGREVYAYLELAQAATLGDGERAALESRGAMVVDRLVRKLAPPAASAGAPAASFYVVETEVAPGWEGELARWYDEEHMPGLAAVEGCVRAQRFVSADAGPWSHACYDLVSADVVTSRAWLAVRASAWSDRVRPNFRNTQRRMFRSLA
jgi:hypothetical protein